MQASRATIRRRVPRVSLAGGWGFAIEEKWPSEATVGQPIRPWSHQLPAFKTLRYTSHESHRFIRSRMSQPARGCCATFDPRLNRQPLAPRKSPPRSIPTHQASCGHASSLPKRRHGSAETMPQVQPSSRGNAPAIKAVKYNAPLTDLSFPDAETSETAPDSASRAGKNRGWRPRGAWTMG